MYESQDNHYCLYKVSLRHVAGRMDSNCYKQRLHGRLNKLQEQQQRTFHLLCKTWYSMNGASKVDNIGGSGVQNIKDHKFDEVIENVEKRVSNSHDNMRNLSKPLSIYNDWRIYQFYLQSATLRKELIDSQFQFLELKRWDKSTLAVLGAFGQLSDSGNWKPYNAGNRSLQSK